MTVATDLVLFHLSVKIYIYIFLACIFNISKYKLSITYVLAAKIILLPKRCVPPFAHTQQGALPT